MQGTPKLGEVFDLCRQVGSMEKHRLGKRHYEANYWLTMLARYLRKKLLGKSRGTDLNSLNFSEVKFVDMSEMIHDERILKIYYRLFEIVHGHYGHHSHRLDNFRLRDHTL